MPTASSRSVTIAAMCSISVAPVPGAARVPSRMRNAFTATLGDELASIQGNLLSTEQTGECEIQSGSVNVELGEDNALPKLPVIPFEQSKHSQELLEEQGSGRASAVDSRAHSARSPGSRIPPLRHPWFTSCLDKYEEELLCSLAVNPLSAGVAIPHHTTPHRVKPELAEFKDVSVIPKWRGSRTEPL